MMSKNNAIEKIDEIYHVIQKSFLVMLPGKLLIGIGLGITSIPLFEYFFINYADPLIIASTAPYPTCFILRTIFYWTAFTLLSKWLAPRPSIHPAIQRAWGLNDLFPIIPVATGGMLALIGHKELVMPIVMIFVGCYWALIGRFTSPIITALAGVYITVGIGSIYLSTFNIPHLMFILLAFQGIGCTIAGFVLAAQQRSNRS